MLQHPNFEVCPYSGPRLGARLKYPIFSAESLDQCGFASTSECAATQHWALGCRIKLTSRQLCKNDLSSYMFLVNTGFSLVFTYMPQGASWISWNRPLIVLPPRHQNRPASGVSSSLRPLLSAAPGAVGLARSRSCQAAEIEDLTTNNRGMNGNSN